MREEEESSILKNKFLEWFEKIVPEPPDVIDHTIGDLAPDDLPLRAEIDLTIGDPGLADLLPRLAEMDYLNHRTIDKSAKLLELLGHGFSVAVYFGIIVGLIIVIFNLIFWGWWHSDNWPYQLFGIFVAMAIGFDIGLINGHASQKRKRHF